MQWLYNNIYLWILSFLFIYINMNCDSNGPLLVHVTIVVPKLKNGSNNFLFHLCWFCLFVLWLLVFFVWLLALMNLRTIYNFFFFCFTAVFDWKCYKSGIRKFTKKWTTSYQFFFSLVLLQNEFKSETVEILSNSCHIILWNIRGIASTTSSTFQVY